MSSSFETFMNLMNQAAEWHGFLLEPPPEELTPFKQLDVDQKKCFGPLSSLAAKDFHYWFGD